MIQLNELAQQRDDMNTIVTLTSIFESLASIHIAQIKNQVQQSQRYFDELWRIYTQIKVNSLFRFGRDAQEKVIDKELLIAITAEGGFSGDIDQKLIEWMVKEHDPAKQDIIVIGHHGAIQLIQAGVQFKKYFKLPGKDQNINVLPLIKYVRGYRNTTVYYQSYVSLMVQDVKKIELQTAVQQAGGKNQSKDIENVISEFNYIFEPSTIAVVAHLERTMIGITLSQVILDSKLAQYASRFRSMSVAQDKAVDSENSLKLSYNRAKRNLSDERLKEIINGLKKLTAAYE
jgi:F-type H+-transporting ATPase subunit gamma